MSNHIILVTGASSGFGPMIVPVLMAGGGTAAACEVGAEGILLAAALVLGVETKGRALEAVSHRREALRRAGAAALPVPAAGDKEARIHPHP